MMVKPWAKAIAAIPGRPTPFPITAAAPAPMNTNEKVPMNSARSLGAIRLGIVLSGDRRVPRRVQVAPRNYGLVADVDGAGERRQAAKGAGLLGGDHLRLEIDAQRLRDAGAICGIGLGAIGDVPLLDVQPGVTHRPRRVLEQLLLLLRRHLAKQVAGLLPMVIV